MWKGFNTYTEAWGWLFGYVIKDLPTSLPAHTYPTKLPAFNSSHHSTPPVDPPMSPDDNNPHTHSVVITTKPSLKHKECAKFFTDTCI